ncbi:MAG TPA: MFS transporter [Actinospica sp.]|nr:MFS transporter [Actinospica sp.]
MPESGPRHALRVTLLMAGSCLPILGAVLISPVLPDIQRHFAGVPGVKALAPLVLTIPALALAILAPFAGIIVDRLGRKRLLIVSTVCYALFGTAPLWLDSLGAILGSRVLVGITEAAIMTCCTTLIGDYYSGRQRERYLALQTMCASGSATVFFVLGGAAGSAGWRTPFWIYAVSLVLAPAMVFALPRPAGPMPDARAEAVRAQRRPFPWRPLASTCALTFFGAMVFYTVPVEMSFLLNDLDVKAVAAIGLATALASAATVIGAVAFTRSKRGHERLLPGTFAVCAAGFAVMALAGDPAVLVLGAVVNCLGTGVLLPSLLTRAMSRLQYADRGRGTGLWTAAFFGGEFACPLIILALEAATGSLASAVGVFAIAAFVLAAALMFMARQATNATRREVEVISRSS